MEEVQEHNVSVTSKKLPNVQKSYPKMFPPEKRKILTPLQKLPKIGQWLWLSW